MAKKQYHGRLAYDPDTDMHHEVRDVTEAVTVDAKTFETMKKIGLTLPETAVEAGDGSFSVVVKRSEMGEPVVTHDDGKSWHFAEEGDATHFERYHQRFAEVDGTAQRLAELQQEHGRVEAEKLMRKEQPHHFAPTSEDPHFSEGAKNARGVVTHTRLKSTPDVRAATETSHTEAWANA